jgi:hypothetical protein
VCGYRLAGGSASSAVVVTDPVAQHPARPGVPAADGTRLSPPERVPTARGSGVPLSPGAEGVLFTGVARDVQRVAATEQMPGVWHFRVERHDDSGNRLAPIPVELRARTLSGGAMLGSLSDGDQVRVAGTWEQGTLVVKAVTNVTTGAEVRNRPLDAGSKVALVVFFTVFTLILLFIGAMVVTGIVSG